MTFRLPKIVLMCLFPAAILYGSWALSDYSYRPGDHGQVVTDLSLLEDVPKMFAVDASIRPGQTNLLLFFHPHCPCTKSCVRNLERLTTSFPRPTQIVAFAYCPTEEPDSWISSATTSVLQRLNANIIRDSNGTHCRRFGVRTSGHILVYSDQGKLLFSGGITPGRGHEGDCPATSDLLKTLSGIKTDVVHWPVYGCLIMRHEVL